MSTITPGPWEFEEADHGYGLVISPPEEYEGLWFTAIVHCVDPLTRTANARAISAVPEMMEALQKMTDVFIAEFGDGIDSREPDGSSVFAGVPDDGDGITFGLLRQARAALAKARGETP